MKRTSSGAIVIFLIASAAVPVAARAEVRIVDDSGTTVVLKAPARRIVSLAPHLVELLYTIGAGATLVATADYSDYPPPAKAIPRIGGSGGVDFERIVALQPDLVVAWGSGNASATVERLRALGLTVYVAELRQLAEIERALVQLGKLTGNETAAQSQATRFRKRYRALQARYAQRTPVRVFYQVLDPTLMTFNGQHLVSELLRLCGGQNLFAELPVLASPISEEAVLSVNPQAIVAGGTEPVWDEWRARWRQRKQLEAVKRNTLYFISADLIHRQSTRVLEGAEQLCMALDDARTRLGKL